MSKEFNDAFRWALRPDPEELTTPPPPGRLPRNRSTQAPAPAATGLPRGGSQ